MRSHRGVVEFAAAHGATQLRWTVEIEPMASALSRLIRRLLEGELARSLDRLVAVAPTTRAGALPPCASSIATPICRRFAAQRSRSPPGRATSPTS